MKQKRILKFVFFTTAAIYAILYVCFYALMQVSLHQWFRFDTFVKNVSGTEIDLTPIARSGYGTHFVLQKNGWFPFDPVHSYQAIPVKPGQTVRLTWDWDDQTLNGFRVRLPDNRVFYHQIDHRPPNQCCYVSDLQYEIDSDSFYKKSPDYIEQLSAFRPIDRWRSYIGPNLRAALFWMSLLVPGIMLFRKGLKI